jgi:Na+/melibiose symporter-like transporter
VLRVRERIIQEKGHVARAKFKDSARDVFRNKYQWMRSIGDVFNKVPNIWEGVITWLFIYITRMPWAFGLMINLYKLPTSSTGQLLTPFFTKRFSKRQNMLFQRLAVAGITILLIPSLGVSNNTLKIVLLMAICCARTFFGAMNDVVNRTLIGDIWDYQQWISGERLEGSINNYFRAVSDPLMSVIGYVLPFLLGRIGFFGDMDMLYDPVFFYRFATTQIWFAVVMAVLSALPFVFYDLTPKKMEQISNDLKARVEAAEAKEALQEEVKAV